MLVSLCFSLTYSAQSKQPQKANVKHDEAQQHIKVTPRRWEKHT